MAKKGIITTLSFILIGLVSPAIAQFSIGGGGSGYFGLNVGEPRFGFNAFVEIPRTPDNTFMVRLAYLLPQKSVKETEVSGKQGVTPIIAPATQTFKTTYFAVDGGTRYYFINDYDIGFAMFAGGYLKGILSSFSAKYRMNGNYDINDYTTSDYPPQPLNSVRPQYSLLFAFGGTVGFKYQIPRARGALVFDIGLEVVTRLVDPQLILGNEISPLSFAMNLAYRFDWYQ